MAVSIAFIIFVKHQVYFVYVFVRNFACIRFHCRLFSNFITIIIVTSRCSIDNMLYFCIIRNMASV